MSSRNINLKYFLKKANFWANILVKLPGVDTIFLSGSLAQGKFSQDSDIDFFIITQPNKIWTARFFVFITLKIFRVIATEKNHAQNICPNHFITTNALEIKEKDAYSAHLFSHNQFLAGNYNIWLKFILINNYWILEFNEHFNELELKKAENNKYVLNNFLKINSKEKNLKKLKKKKKLKKIKKNPNYTKKNAKIILTNTELRFHPTPKNLKWKKLVTKITDNDDIVQ